MNTQKAKTLAQEKLEGVDRTNSSAILGAVNDTIQELMHYRFLVLCPVTRQPLQGVGLAQDGLIEYSPAMFVN